jgi:hypothetical protein
VCLDVKAPHRHFVVDVTITSARTITGAPQIDARLSLPGGTSHFRFTWRAFDDYYPFALKDGGRFAPMAVELLLRMAILLTIRRFVVMNVADSRSWRSDIYVRMPHFVCGSTYVLFQRCLLGVGKREFMHRLSTVVHGTLDSYIRDASQE